MKLLPRLVKKTILISLGFTEKNDENIDQQIVAGRKQIDAEVWEEVGLCVHACDDGHERHKWRISHVESGRAILRGMRSREHAIEYLMKLHTIWREWFYPIEKMQRILQIKPGFVDTIKALQQSIKKENNEFQKGKRQSGSRYAIGAKPTNSLSHKH